MMIKFGPLSITTKVFWLATGAKLDIKAELEIVPSSMESSTDATASKAYDIPIEIISDDDWSDNSSSDDE